MRESSPALGGAIVGAAMLLALVYGLGYSHQFADLIWAIAGQIGDLLSTTAHAMQRDIANTS